MNCTIEDRIIQEAYERDAAVTASEWGGEFRKDIESYVSPEAVEACVVPDRRELPPISTCSYLAFIDAAGGSGSDSMAMAIAHQEDGKRLLDAIREVRPPFSPDSVVKEFADLLKSYRINSAAADRFAGEWPAERFREYGISYVISKRSKSQIYQSFLPLINSRQIELLDHPRMVNQIASLERRSGRNQDFIDHPPGPHQHDDMANCCAGVLNLVGADNSFFSGADFS